MKKICFFMLLLSATTITVYSQQPAGGLTVEKIMKDPQWIGTSPSNQYWSADSKYVLFNWNPDKKVSDSLYYITPTSLIPQKTTYAFRQNLLLPNTIKYNTKRTHYVYADEGDIYLAEVKTGTRRRIMQTMEQEFNPQFSFNDSKVVYTSGRNLYAWDIASGLITQLTNFQASANTTEIPASGGFQRGNRSRSEVGGNAQEKWLQ